jgi:hypothetical protein
MVKWQIADGKIDLLTRCFETQELQGVERSRVAASRDGSRSGVAARWASGEAKSKKLVDPDVT